ncbi:hypothetical protein B7463_g12386, partial [Scytalidium lignicola]
MLSRPSGCCRVVQHQLRTSSDSIWLSEDMLARSFQRFCAISKTARRYGSSVPGPMESRRRLGRRRMAHASEAVPIPRQQFPTFWGTFEDVDMTQWHWQPPKSRPSEPINNKTLLPKWLVEWDNVAENMPFESEDFQMLQNSTFQGQLEIDIEINKFRDDIQMATSSKIDDICKEFNQKLKHALVLGLVSDATLEILLLETTKVLRAVSRDIASTNSRCIALYLAIWQGIASSKVVRSVDFDGQVLATFVSLLSQLPSTTAIQSMAREILTSVSNVQLEIMIQSVISLVKSWMSAWLEDCCLSDCRPSLNSTEAAVMESDYHIRQLESLIIGMMEEPYSEKGIATAQKLIKSCMADILSGIENVAKIDLEMSSLKTSVKTLGVALGNIPQRLLTHIIQTGSDHVLHEYFPIGGRNTNSFRAVRYCWLSFIGRSRFVDDELFIKEWQKMECRNVFLRGLKKSATPIPLTASETSDLVLSRWISQGFLSSASSVENTFSAYGQDRELALLLSAIDRHRENFWTRTKDLVSLLHKLGRHKSVYQLFNRMADLDLKVPASLVASVIDNMSAFNPRLGLNLFKMYYRIRHDNKPLRADGCPNLIISLINDPNIHPRAIWDILGIPMLEPIKHLRKPILVLKPLPKSRVDLIHKMALAFSRSDSRSQRVALRNVMQCAMYLRMHQAEVRPDLSKAISYAGITREIIREHWIGTERLNWALGIISWIEGKEVAQTVDKAAQRWRENLVQKQRSHRRESNVLKVGPIE